MRVVQFAVVLKRDDGAWRWCVTCERCGLDIPLGAGGITIFKVRALTELMALAPDAAEAMTRHLRTMFDDAVRTGRPMVVDRDDVDVERVADMRSMFEQHADLCGGGTC